MPILSLICDSEALLEEHSHGSNTLSPEDDVPNFDSGFLTAPPGFSNLIDLLPISQTTSRNTLSLFR